MMDTDEYIKLLLWGKDNNEVCEECKRCWNYLVCEVGCYGSDKPCEYLRED